jgi:hypothetical protein
MIDFSASADERDTRRKQARTPAVPMAPAPITALIEVLLCLPTAPALLLERSGDFGTSPIYGQLSDKQLLAYGVYVGCLAFSTIGAREIN